MRPRRARVSAQRLWAQGQTIPGPGPGSKSGPNRRDRAADSVAYVRVPPPVAALLSDRYRRVRAGSGRLNDPGPAAGGPGRLRTAHPRHAGGPTPHSFSLLTKMLPEALRTWGVGRRDRVPAQLVRTAAAQSSGILAEIQLHGPARFRATVLSGCSCSVPRSFYERPRLLAAGVLFSQLNGGGD